MLSKEEMEGYCEEYYSPIYRYCLSRLTYKADAEDATQETFVIFNQKGHMLKSEHVKPWLITTAHHMVLKEYKRRSAVKDRECHFDEEMLEFSRKVRTFEDDLVDYYMGRHLTEIYARLNENEKELFDLCSDGNIKTGQIAQLLGLEPHACSMRKLRLKERCREIMAEILFF